MHRITGVQRYAHEIAARLQEPAYICTPDSAKGAIGHLWEQTILPLACCGRLLWSPCGSGPLGYSRHVVTFHDLFPIEFPEWYSPLYSRWYKFAMSSLAARAVHLIAVSEYTKSRIVSLLGRSPEDVTVIYNGCNTKERACPEEINAARAALDLPSGRYVLSLSSLESRKNVGSLLTAWSEIHQLLPDTWLVLAGPKADEAVYGKQNVEAAPPRVLYTGYVPEEHLTGLYSGASLFLFPSLAEGFGLPLLEAMACGTRCVTSNTSSLPEVGGDVVDYVHPRNTEDLARTILERLREHGGPPVAFVPVMERARQFTWDAAAAKTRDVFAMVREAAPKRLLAPFERMDSSQ